MTYHVLIVDDEYYIRQRLKTCIHWEDAGFQIVGEASNANEAFTFLTKNSVHLAIVDISMPQKDGLSLIHEMREKNISTKIIILSGYGTFDYAQKAIEYGVTQYLLKPIDEEKLLEALSRIRQTLDEEALASHIKSEKHRADYLLASIRKELFFQKLFSSHPIMTSDIESLYNGLKEYQLSLETWYRILIFDFQYQNIRTLSQEHLQLFRDSACNILCELLQPDFTSVHTADVYGHIVLLCKIPDDLSDKTEFFSNRIENIATKIKELFKLYISIGISPSFRLSIQNMHTYYNYALYAYVLSNIRKTDYTVYSSESVPTPNISVLSSLLPKIEVCFSSGNETELLRCLELYFSHLEDAPSSFAFLEQGLSLLSASFLQKGSDAHQNLASVWEFTHPEQLKELLFAGYDFSYLTPRLCNLFIFMLHNHEVDVGGSTKQELVSEAARFIESYYARNDLSLTLIAQNLLISPSYLSSIFKKVRGLSISQYLNQIRLTKAKELLTETSLTLTEIAQRVGYNDLFYFSKVFKKYFGIPPSSYKK